MHHRATASALSPECTRNVICQLALAAPAKLEADGGSSLTVVSVFGCVARSRATSTATHRNDQLTTAPNCVGIFVTDWPTRRTCETSY